MGGMTAPVSGSWPCPAWMAKVSRCSALLMESTTAHWGAVQSPSIRERVRRTRHVRITYRYDTKDSLALLPG